MVTTASLLITLSQKKGLIILTLCRTDQHRHTYLIGLYFAFNCGHVSWFWYNFV